MQMDAGAIPVANYVSPTVVDKLPVLHFAIATEFAPEVAAEFATFLSTKDTAQSCELFCG